MSRERVQQIKLMKDQCKSLNPVVSGDDSQWFIQLVDKNMHELYKIFLFLPKGFPTTPPKVTVSVPLNHPWVDLNTKAVNHPDVVAWSRHGEIGLVMMSILREFTTKKPAIVQPHSEAPKVGTVEPTGAPVAKATLVIESVAMPVIPSEFKELQNIPIEQLEVMDTDPVALDAYIETMPLVEKYKDISRTSENQSKDLATILAIEHKKLLNEQSEQATSLSTVQQTHRDLDNLLKHKDMILSKFTPKSLLKDLSEVMESTDKQSADLTKDFKSLEDYKKQLIDQRILYHKAAALSELISANSCNSRIFPQDGTSPGK